MNSTLWRWIGAAWMVIFLAGVAHADPPADDPAKIASDAYQRGMVHFQLDEYEAAIKEWEDGFRTKPAPQFIYNIAQAYRAWNKPDKALSFYRKYLNMDPKSPNRAAVERHISELTEIVEAQKNAPPPVTPAPVVKPVEPAPPVPTVPTVPPPVEVTPAPAPVAITVAPVPQKPLAKRPWFIGTMTAVGVVVVAGVVVGVLLGTRSSGPQVLDPVRF